MLRLLLVLALLMPAAAPAQTLAKATFAAGCFWCTEEAFDKIPGVVETVSGYMGGKTKNPTYEQVSAGITGHTEVLQVTYDPAKVSYATLLEVFWINHDPTVVGPTILRPRLAIPAGHLHARRGAEAACRGVEGKMGEGQAVQGEDPHADRARRGILEGGGLPPGLPFEEPGALPLLLHRLRALLAAGRPVG